MTPDELAPGELYAKLDELLETIPREAWALFLLAKLAEVLERQAREQAGL